MEKLKRKRGRPFKIHTGGRPREWTEPRIEKERIALEKWIANPKNYYFLSFLTERNLDQAQVDRFCNYSERFRQTHAKAKAIQEQRIVQGALEKRLDGGFAKFVLANKAGWREKNEISGDQANPLAVIMQRIADSPKELIEHEG